MKKKSPIAPVRANVRGTRELHSISMLTVSPGATGVGIGTESTVRSSGLLSSGETKRRRSVRSWAPASPSSRTAVTSIQPQSASGLDASPGPRPSSRSRIQVERLFLQAL